MDTLTTLGVSAYAMKRFFNIALPGGVDPGATALLGVGTAILSSLFESEVVKLPTLHACGAL